jgi:hypothetical protein
MSFPKKIVALTCLLSAPFINSMHTKPSSTTSGSSTVCLLPEEGVNAQNPLSAIEQTMLHPLLMIIRQGHSQSIFKPICLLAL